MLLAFDDDGPGPVVVLLHGFPLDRSMWANQRSSVGAIYRVIAPDLRGHGTSAAPEGTYTVDEMADDVIETLDALQLTGPLVVGGLSMGGYLALSIAVRYPGRVRALMLMNTRAAADQAEDAEARREKARKVEASGDVEPVVTEMLPRLFARSTFERHPELVARMQHRMSRMTPRAVAGTLRGLAARPDRTADLARIVVPTLVLAGEEDRMIPPAETQAMAGALPDARLVTIPGAGHVSPMENPAATDAAILGFLREGW
jgi:pimeloyl-ACP methyl ester carboxylesterase